MYSVYTFARIAAEKYRETVIGQPLLSKADFDSTVRTKGYVHFSASRKGHAFRPDLHAIWVIVGAGSQVSREVKSFRSMWNAIGVQTGDNIVIITDTQLGHYIRKEIDDMQRSDAGLYIEDVPADLFRFETPTHQANCRHTIVSPDELTQYLETTYADPNFKKILSTDPQVVWIGARAGDIVKIDVTSFSAGIAVDYRVCV